MKVLEQTRQRLVFQTSPIPSAVFAAIALIIGIVLISLASSGVFAGGAGASTARRMLPTILAFAGACVLAGGVALFLFVVGSITCTFDRVDGSITLLRKRMIGTRTDSHRLGDLAGAEIEEQRSSSSDGGGPTYRTALVFTDGRRVPLGSIYVSGRATQEQKVAVIETFLKG
jgi:hypothetical protein